MTLKLFNLKRRFYVVLVSRDESGELRKVPVPLHYAYTLGVLVVIGLFTSVGLFGSYSKMLIKTERFNQLRDDHAILQKDYAHLQVQAHEKDIQAASLGSLAGEVEALYGLTASKLSGPAGRGKNKAAPKMDGIKTAQGALNADAASNFTDDSYYKSLNAFYSLRDSAVSGEAAHMIDGGAVMGSLAEIRSHAAVGGDAGSTEIAVNAPNLWPVMGPIRSSFGQREDPVTGNGEGEFHTGIDISAPIGTPIRATADGVVKSAAMENGYGREVVLDHGHNLETCYAHMSGFAVMAGESVVRGQVIGYVGMSGRTTGAHLHYEVRIHNTPVNPYKYLRSTMSGMSSQAAGL